MRKQDFEKSKKDLNELLAQEMTTGLPDVFREAAADIAAHPGKQLRPVSLLVCAMDGQGMIPEDAVYAAAALELVHLASLAHDDVIDDSPLRRGRVTLQKKVGKKAAVLCGDYFLYRAMNLASRVQDKTVRGEKNLPLLVRCLGRLCLGELRQTEHLFCLETTLPQYLKIITGKTAALFEAAYHMGAILSGADDRVQRRYARLGRMAGTMFQISDDCMDYEAKPEAAEKAVQKDFATGVMTLPLIYAIADDEGLKEELAARDWAVSAETVQKAVFKTGGIEKSMELSAKYYQKSMKILENLRLSGEKKEQLSSMVDRAYTGLRK